jgi:plasmid stabilization system protein ParE
MTARQGFQLHPEAAQDITEIWEYIAERSPRAATGVREDILQALRNIVSFPESGHRRPDLTGRPLRFLRVREYLVAYAPDEDPLWVIAVLHGRRNPRVMAAILRGREAGEAV